MRPLKGERQHVRQESHKRKYYGYRSTNANNVEFSSVILKGYVQWTIHQHSWYTQYIFNSHSNNWTV